MTGVQTCALPISKITADGDCSHETKRRLLLGKVMTNLDSIFKSRDITLPTKVCLVKVSYEVEMIKGLGNIFLGGEGLFLTKLTGPGKVIIQSQNFGDFAGKVLSILPKK